MNCSCHTNLHVRCLTELVVKRRWITSGRIAFSLKETIEFERDYRVMSIANDKIYASYNKRERAKCKFCIYL